MLRGALLRLSFGFLLAVVALLSFLNFLTQRAFVTLLALLSFLNFVIRRALLYLQAFVIVLIGLSWLSVAQMRQVLTEGKAG